MTARSTALALLAAVVLLTAGCGQDSEQGDPIPASVAGTLQQRLRVIQSQLDQGGGACADILDKTQPVVEGDLDRIPDSVDPDVRRALRESFDRLFDLASRQCDDTAGQETTPTETETTPPEPTPTETQQTETQRTETQRTETQQQTQPQQQPGDEDGGGSPAPRDEGE